MFSIWWGSAYLVSHGMGNGRIFLFFGKEELGFVEYVLKYNQKQSKVLNSFIARC